MDVSACAYNCDIFELGVTVCEPVERLVSEIPSLAGRTALLQSHIPLTYI